MSKPAVRLDTPAARIRAWLGAMIGQHNLVNLIWLNFHPVVEGKVYRSAQPTSGQLKKLAKRYALRSVVNLRGAKPHRPVWALEKRACEEAGVELLDVSIYSRRIPDDRMLLSLKEAFTRARTPMLMHCKAGADRSSLASVLYLYWMEGVPLEKAMEKHLRFWPFGYIRRSGAGVIAAYFEAFLEYRREHPDADLVTWSRRWRDRGRRKAFEESFRKGRVQPFVDFVYEKILRRE